MNNLPAQTAASPPTSISSPISTRLWKLLSSPVAGATEIADIVADPELHAEAKVAAPLLAQRAKPVGETAVRHALQPLVLVFGMAEAARSPAFWVPYLVLASLPAEALAKGVQDYLAAPDSEFFPKPGPLKALCAHHARPILQAAHRASEAAKREPPRQRSADADAVKRMLADYQAKAKERPNPMRSKRVELANTAGKPDERGLTAEMRKAMARLYGSAAGAESESPRAEGGAA